MMMKHMKKFGEFLFVNPVRCNSCGQELTIFYKRFHKKRRFR